MASLAGSWLLREFLQLEESEVGGLPDTGLVGKPE